MLTADHMAWRNKGIGGSDARTIVTGTADDWQALKREKIEGIQPFFTDDQRFMMDLGTAAEPVILDRVQKTHGQVGKRGLKLTMPADPYFRCTLDGMNEAGTPVQAKFHFGNKSMDDLVEYYWPQLQHEMLVTSSPNHLLAVAFGQWAKFEVQEVEQDYEFQNAYMVRALQFKEYCWGNAPLPEGLATEGIQAPIPTNIPRLRDHIWPENDNEVAHLATDWLETADAASTNATVSKELKKLVPEDCRSAMWLRNGSGIRITISKSGAKSIKAYSVHR